MEKAQKAAREAKQLQEFHRSQMVERRARDRAERNGECNYTKTNMNLLKVHQHPVKKVTIIFHFTMLGVHKIFSFMVSALLFRYS